MSELEIKLRGYIAQVAIMEVPLIKLLTGLMTVCNGQIPEDATLGGIINYYISQIPDISIKAENDTQENYDKIYEEFLAILDAHVNPAIDEMVNDSSENDINELS